MGYRYLKVYPKNDQYILNIKYHIIIQKLENYVDNVSV